MRALSALVLFCVLALGLSGSLRATEMDQANTQALITGAKSVAAGVFKDVSLTFKVNVNGTITDKTVVFTLFRDALGSVTAKPKLNENIDGMTITQVNIQFSVGASGLLAPVAMVVQDGANIKKVEITADTTGTISGLTTVTGGIVNVTKTVDSVTTTSDAFAAFGFLDFSAGASLRLPAGSESGKASVWQP